MWRNAVFIAACLLVPQLGSAEPAAESARIGGASNEPVEGTAALERLLCGRWKGGACVGELKLRRDGVFERKHHSPGGNSLTGEWKVRWNALPPTLVLVCKTSDDLERFPAEKTWEMKLTQLDDGILAYEFPKEKPIHYTRLPE